jgi:hypothetical protein
LPRGNNVTRTFQRRGPLLLIALLLLLSPAVAGPASADEPATYTNPVTASFTRNFADPTVIRGRDGFWYAYATNGRQTADGERHLMMMAKSSDLVHWTDAGDVFTPETMPRYDGLPEDANRQFWAPSIEYFGGRYLLYYSYVANAVGHEQSWRVIGVATADHPAGPWTDTGAFVTGPETWEPRPGQTAWRNVIDPEVVATPDGKRYLYYGSVLGGVRVVELSPDGLHAVGDRTQLTPSNRFEAAYVVRRGGYYYLFLSVIGGCCAGPVSNYPVVVARSTSPLGPFVDRNGHPVSGDHAGGTPVQAPNGNQWLSPGHNAIATDPSGQDWLVTHGIDRYQPFVGGTESARGMMINRLDWIDGWPVAAAGAGLPSGAAPAPDNSMIIGDSFEDGLDPAWRQAPGWSVRREPAGGYLQVDAAAAGRQLESVPTTRGDHRARAAVRLDDHGAGRAGLVLGRHGCDGGVEAVIDHGAAALVVTARVGRRTVRATAPLPASFAYQDWHELALSLRGGTAHAEVSDAGLDDPVAEVELDLPRGPVTGPFALVADEAVADFDDVTVAAAHEPVTERIPEPMIGTADPANSDEFDDDLGPRWQWVRDPTATVDGGTLRMPIQLETLIDQRGKPDDAASVLLREPPPGEWTAETKITVPFGETLPYGWPMAGLIAYAGDDDWIVAGSSALIKPRYVTFGTESTSYDGVARYAFAAVGPPADTMWLRLRHVQNPDNGEHSYQLATSVDHDHWVWQGAYTLAAGPQPRIGLVAMDRDPDPQRPDGLTATFDYLRFYRTESPSSR